MKKIHKIAAYLLVGTMVIAGHESVAKATVDDTSGIVLQESEEPIAGIDLAINEAFENTDQAQKEITQSLPDDSSADSTPENENLAFAKVTNYVNIRSKADENGDILGKLYDNSSAVILSKKNGWYKIKSGSVSGYIKAEFLVTGDEAAKLANKVGNRVAEVTTTTLKVREKPSADSDVTTLVAQGDDLKVIKELDGWVKAHISENETGYVSTDFVKVQTVYEEAVSIEEEQQNLEDEAVSSQAADHSKAGSSASARSSSRKSTVGRTSAASSSSGSTKVIRSSGSSLGSRIASFAIQFEGNPYVWGGTSLTNGTDCSGFTQSVFAHFGISIPRTSRTQATGGSRVSVSNLHAGDLIFYARNGSINHVALYIGNGKVISASSPSTGIRISSYSYRTPIKAVSYIN